jgi:hypothetical protein
VLFAILQWLGHGYGGYRAFQDAGGWFLELEAPARLAFMQSHFILGSKE